MIKGKKGSWPSDVIYVIFSMIHLIFAIFIILILISNILIKADFIDSAVRYYSYSARIIGSPSCLAYANGDGVYLGIVDWEKREGAKNCLERKHCLIFKSLNSNSQEEECSISDTNAVSDTFYVLVNKKGKLEPYSLTIKIEK